MRLDPKQRARIVQLLNDRGRTDLILTGDVFYDNEVGCVADDHFAIACLIGVTFPGAIDSALLLRMFESALLLSKE